VEIVLFDVELFYPFELGIYAALCLAGSWIPWRRRLRAMVLGLPLLVGIEILSLVLALRVLRAGTEGPAAAQRLADAALFFARGSRLFPSSSEGQRPGIGRAALSGFHSLVLLP
jgi:hypothetical protein